MSQATVVLGSLTIPEGLRWHEGRLWFSDMYARRVVSVLEDGSDLRVEAELPAVSIGIDWLPDGRLLVTQWEPPSVLRREHDGTWVMHGDLAAVCKSKPNDLIVLPDGTAIVGCFGFDIHSNADFETAPLMRISPDGQVSAVGEPSYFPNGCALLDGGRTMVVSESFGNRMSQYDVGDDASLSNRRDWATFGPMPTATALNDRFQQMVVACDGISKPDVEGAIWVADFTKYQAIRVMPGGEIVDTVTTAGDLNCFCPALGGADGRTLFLCAAPGDYDPSKDTPGGTIQAHRVDVPLATMT
jgi:sugar lactone lactonase YvrE